MWRSPGHFSLTARYIEFPLPVTFSSLFTGSSSLSVFPRRVLYIRGGKREKRLHPGREKGNPVTSGERKRKFGYIRGEEKECGYIQGGKIRLHPGRAIGNAVTCGERKRNTNTSGDKKRKSGYIRGGKMRLHPGREEEIQIHPGRRKGNAVTSREESPEGRSRPMSQ